MSRLYQETRRRYLKCPECKKKLELWIHLNSIEKFPPSFWVDYVSFEDKEKEELQKKED